MALFLAACAGTPPPVPEWVRNMEAVYPRSAYIAQRGEGATRQEAELTALNAVSFYFESEITAEESARQSWSEQNGVTHSESRTETATLVRSQTRLTAVRYAEDPWRNSATGLWESAAFINREEAWTVYEPQAARVRDGLLTLTVAAEADGEPFSQALRFGAAAVYADSPAFNAARGFAQVLHPTKARSLFAEADTVRAALPEKIYTSRQRAAVFIDCPTDMNGLVYQAALAAFGAEGFPVERNRAAASTVCLIQVDEGAQKLDSGTFFTPSLTGTVNSKAGAVFSFSVTSARQSAINPEVGRRRAYTAPEGAVISEIV